MHNFSFINFNVWFLNLKALIFFHFIWCFKVFFSITPFSLYFYSAKEAQLQEYLMECASTMKHWRNTIKTKAQGLIQDKEDIIQKQQDRDKIIARVSEIKREVEQFNQKAEDYNKNNRTILMNASGKTSILFFSWN